MFYFLSEVKYQNLKIYQNFRGEEKQHFTNALQANGELNLKNPCVIKISDKKVPIIYWSIYILYLSPFISYLISAFYFDNFGIFTRPPTFSNFINITSIGLCFLTFPIGLAKLIEDISMLFYSRKWLIISEEEINFISQYSNSFLRLSYTVHNYLKNELEKIIIRPISAETPVYGHRCINKIFGDDDYYSWEIILTPLLPTLKLRE